MDGIENKYQKMESAEELICKTISDFRAQCSYSCSFWILSVTGMHHAVLLHLVIETAALYARIGTAR